MDAPLPPGTLIDGDRYRVDRALDAGGFSHVYVARDTELRREVIVKEFFPDGMRRGRDGEVVPEPGEEEDYARWLRKFIEEGIFLAQVAHPSIVNVFDIVRERNTAYLVLEKLFGETLADLLKQHRITESLLERWITRLVDALARVHERGILHLDIKPENVIVTFAGHPVLIDFGSARTMGSSTDAYSFTRGYASPELARGQLDILSPASDIYSLGVIIHEILTGDLPDNGIHLSTPERWRPVLSTALNQDPGTRGVDVRLWWGLLGQGRNSKRFIVPRENPRYFHTLAGCPFLKGYEVVRKSHVGDLDPCDLCGSPHLQAPRYAKFIAPGGQYYHSSRGCFRLNWSPRAPEVVYEIGEREACEYCISSEEE